MCQGQSVIVEMQEAQNKEVQWESWAFIYPKKRAQNPLLVRQFSDFHVNTQTKFFSELTVSKLCV